MRHSTRKTTYYRIVSIYWWYHPFFRNYKIIFQNIALILVLPGIQTIAGVPVLSAGQFAGGFLAAGNFALGIFAAGIFAAGLFAAGIFSIGVFSVGIFSIGIFAISLFPLGIFPTGVVAGM